METKIIKKHPVNQHNILTQNNIYNTLDEVDRRVLKVLFSRIDSNDTLFNEFYTVDYEILDLAGVTKRNRYSIVQSSLKKLAGIFLKIPTKNGDIMECGLIKNKFIFKPKTQKFVFSMDEDMQPYLAGLKERFSSFYLNEIKYLKGNSELALFELLNSFKKDGQYTTNIDNLVLLLDLKKSFKRWADLKRWLNKVAIKFESTTRIYFTVLKPKRHDDTITFTIFEKDKKLQIDLEKYIGKSVYTDDIYIIKSIKFDKDAGYYKVTVLPVKDLSKIATLNFKEHRNSKEDFAKALDFYIEEYKKLIS